MQREVLERKLPPIAGSSSPTAVIRLPAVATEHARNELGRAAAPLTVLGAFPTALYLGTAEGGVLALLTRDAVQLPIGVTLPVPSGSMPLGGYTGSARSEAGTLSVSGVAGILRVVPGQLRPTALRPVGEPMPCQVEQALRLFAASGTEVEDVLAHRLVGAPDLADASTAVAALLGRGPGLTPAGDDLLCGALAGTVLFGRPVEPMRRAVLDQLTARPRATTSLSRQLLLSAVAGHGLAELSSLGRALCGSDAGVLSEACARLSAIGHSSGAALAAGVLAVAESAVRAGNRQKCE